MNPPSYNCRFSSSVFRPFLSRVFDKLPRPTKPPATFTAHISCTFHSRIPSLATFHIFPIFTASITNKRRRWYHPPFPIRFRTFAPGP